MSLYRKLTLAVSSVLVCAAGAIFSLVSGLVAPPGGSAEHDADANALRNVGHIVETQGMISGYSIAAWTDSLDMTLDTALDTSHAATIAYQVCSVSKVALHGPWIVRLYLVNGRKVAECEIDR
jgi:hypothetical protein